MNGREERERKKKLVNKREREKMLFFNLPPFSSFFFSLRLPLRPFFFFPRRLFWNTEKAPSFCKNQSRI